jgi:pimeloyl-ACP methyl ester carboxylesterase
VTAPTLMLLGGDSPPLVKRETEMVAAALPDVRTTVLNGQQHVAIDTAPQLFAEAVVAFLRSG